MKKITYVLFISLMISSCTNSSKFSCTESLGANCVMLSLVDKMVDSGEIEKYYENKKRLCLFSRCLKKDKSFTRPYLSNNQELKAQIIDNSEKDRLVRDGEYIYVK